MRNIKRIVMAFLILVISGCQAETKVNLEDSMSAVIDYTLYEIGAEPSDEVNQWLTNASIAGEEGQSKGLLRL